ncbi:MAG: cytochrome P450 [Cryomorphaceae bacterium]|nr:cytochrome P450 [Cryomorphaceae bacterium]
MNNGPSILKSFKFVSNTSVFIEENLCHYGGIFKLSIPFHSIYAIANPDVLQHVLVRNESNYIKSKIYWAQLRAVVGDALGTYEGEDWVWMKKLQMKSYTKEQAQGNLDEVIRSNDIHFSEWNTLEKPVDLIHAFSKLNVAILLKVLFGFEQSGLCERIAQYIAEGEETISWRSTFPWRPYTGWLNGRNQRYKKSIQYIGKLTDEIIENNLRETKVGSLIETLLSESDFTKEKARIDRDIIRNELIIHLGAGTETAAVGMGWVFYLLHKHPQIKKQLEDEIREIVGNDPVRPEHAYQLPFTDLVLKEALRLYPPSHGLVRDAVEKDQIGNLEVKPGDTFFISSYALHRNPEFWDRPNDFIPERFANEPQKYTYVPFGAGKHTCIGRYLARPMMILALAQFFQKYDFEMSVSEPVIPVSMATLKPNQPLYTRVVKRVRKNEIH